MQISDTPTPMSQDVPADRRPWAAPAITEIDLSEKTEAGSDPYSTEGTTFPNDRYTS